jgi:L-histidine N-alpha-methyltransferase
MQDERARDSATDAERAALREGLCRPLPELAPKYLYDDRGSALFERIIELEEYYPTRTEVAILERDAAEIMADAKARRIVELGSGAGKKIRLLLERWPERDEGGLCTMLDVNQRFLEASVRALSDDFRGCRFNGVLGDFTEDLDRVPAGGPRLTVFFAGTIGNLHTAERHAFFSRFAATMERGDSLLVGLDLVKDVARIERAYNDRAGVTAEFNKNALRVVNARFGADFDVDAFEHRAFYDVEQQRIEMRLRAKRATSARVASLDLSLSFAQGAELRTEVSCKFTRERFARELSAAGLSLGAWRTDEEQLFALAHVWRIP